LPAYKKSDHKSKSVHTSFFEVGLMN